MIVRIMGEGQLTLADGRLTELNKLDDELLAEMENGDGPGFSARPSSPSWPRSANWASRSRTTPWSRPTSSSVPGRHPWEGIRELLSDDGLIPGSSDGHRSMYAQPVRHLQLKIRYPQSVRHLQSCGTFSPSGV